MTDLLIRDADWVVTVDRRRRIIRNGAVAIEGNKIQAVGKTEHIAREYKADTVIDGHGKLVTPGLVESHVHHVQNIARGFADEVNTIQWILGRIYPVESKMTSKDAYTSALACQLEMIKAGTTCFIEPGNYYPDETAEATEKSGMRGVIARTCYDLKEPLAGKSLPKDESKFWESTEQTIERAERTYEKWNGACSGRIKGSYELRVPYFCTDELCKGIKEAADRHGALIQSHAAMDDFTTQASLVRWGAREVERLNRLGVLGPNVLLIHMTHASPSEVLMLKEHDVKVAACPSASLHDAYGAFSCGAFPEMTVLGITVCLGSDGAPSSNFLDMVRQMYLMAGGPKDAAVDATAMLPETVMEMATINGAKAALWDNEIGSIETGKKADITIFDMNRPEWRPVINPISNLVYSANGSSADTVIVDGRILMEGRKVQTLDEERILKEIQEASSKIVERAGLTDAVRSRWPIE